MVGTTVAPIQGVIQTYWEVNLYLIKGDMCKENAQKYEFAHC